MTIETKNMPRRFKCDTERLETLFELYAETSGLSVSAKTRKGESEE